MSKRINRYNQFYLESVSIQNQKKGQIAKDMMTQIFESKSSKGKKLDLVNVLIEKEVYKDGKINESISHYLYDDDFKRNLRYDACAGFTSHGISELKDKTMNFLIESNVSQKDYEFIDKRFDVFLLGDKRIIEGFLKWIAKDTVDLLSPFIDIILKPGWNALKTIGSKMFGEEIMNKIESIGKGLIEKISNSFDTVDQKFQNILDKTWSGIKSIAQKIGDFLKSFWETCKKVFNMIWDFIKEAAKGAMGSIGKSPKLKKLTDILNSSEIIPDSESKDSTKAVNKGQLDNEIGSYGSHWSKLSDRFTKGPLETEASEVKGINQAAKNTFNPSGDTEVKKSDEKDVKDNNSMCYSSQFSMIYDSLLFELKNNQNFKSEDLVNMNESMLYEAHKEGISLKEMEDSGDEGKLAAEVFIALQKSVRGSNDFDDTLSAIKSIKSKSDIKKIDSKEVAKKVDDLIHSFYDKMNLAKWCNKEYKDKPEEEKQLHIILKDLDLEYDPSIDFNENMANTSKEFWNKINKYDGSGLEDIMNIMKKWEKEEYSNINKQSKFKYGRSLSGQIRDRFSGEFLESDNDKLQILLVEEKKKKNLSDDFKVDAYFNCDKETKDIWTNFFKAWNRKNIDDIQDILLKVEDPKLYDKLDSICRQELKFSLKKKLVDQFTGWFKGKATKEKLSKIIDHLQQDKFVETSSKSEEAVEESGLIMKWCKSAVSFLLSPLGKLVEFVSKMIGKAIFCIPGMIILGISWEVQNKTFQILPEILAIVVGIAVDGYCVYKGIKGFGGHEGGHHKPEDFLSMIGGRIKHGAEEVGLGKVVHAVEGGLDKVNKITGAENTKKHESSSRYIKTRYNEFIKESNIQSLKESAEKPDEGGKGFPWKRIAGIGGSLLISYIANLFVVSFPVVAIVLEAISIILLLFHVIDILRSNCPKWWGEKGKLAGISNFAHKILSSIGMGH